MEWLFSYEILAAFLTLTAIEIVLGIDNIVFISIVTNRLPVAQRRSGRTIGLGLAMIMRILLLLTLTWIMGLTAELFQLFEQSISGRDLILFFGGLFLFYKATAEIHNSLGVVEAHESKLASSSFALIMTQIAVIDIVFSLDSVITAVGLVDHVEVMIAAIVVAVLFMMVAVNPVSRFIEDHPSLKILALAFLVLIGFALVVESFGIEVPKPYIYAAMAFAFFVEILNILRTRHKSVRLRKARFHDLYPVENSTS